MPRQHVTIIKLYGPVAEEFDRQRAELEDETGEDLSNPLFVAYMLDIRRRLAKQLRSDEVDSHAQEILGHDDPEPKGEVS